MSNTANRKRPIQVKFFVDENELAAIKQRMVEFGTDNLSAYLRTMAMEGIRPAAHRGRLHFWGKSDTMGKNLGGGYGTDLCGCGYLGMCEAGGGPVHG